MYLTVKTVVFTFVLGLVLAFGQATSVAQDTVTLTVGPASGPDGGYVISGPDALPLGGKLVLKNGTGKLISVTLCYGGDSQSLGPVDPGENGCFDIPAAPVLAGTSGTLKVQSRCGKGSKEVKFVTPEKNSFVESMLNGLSTKSKRR